MSDWQEEAIEIERRKSADEDKKKRDFEFGKPLVEGFWRKLVSANNELPTEIRLTYEDHRYSCNERLFKKPYETSEQGLIYETKTASITRYSIYNNDGKLEYWKFRIYYDGKRETIVAEQLNLPGKNVPTYYHYQINDACIDILLRNLCLEKKINEGLSYFGENVSSKSTQSISKRSFFKTFFDI